VQLLLHHSKPGNHSDLGFIVFNSLNLILNILICVVLYKIIIFIRAEDHEKEEKRVVIYISIYLMSLPNFFNYILGQINLYVTLLILLSLYIYLKYNGMKWELIASILLGISIIIKPITIFMIPFILIIHYDLISRKLKFDVTRSFIRLIGIVLPLSLNLIMFLILPNLLDGFIEANFTSSEPSQINHSFSITKLIINFLYFTNFGIIFGSFMAIVPKIMRSTPILINSRTDSISLIPPPT